MLTPWQYDRIQSENQRQYVERERLALQAAKLAAELEEARDVGAKHAIERDMLQRQLDALRDRAAAADDQVPEAQLWVGRRP